MAAARTAYVSTTSCGSGITREGYGGQLTGSSSSRCSSSGGGSGVCSLPRTAFCGEKLAASVKAQKGLPGAAAGSRRNAAGGVFRVSSVLADINQSFVNTEEKDWVDPRTVLSIILGGGVGTRLFPLTKGHAKPAVPLGGAYRLIGVPMSNCTNSGINKVFILTQFNSTSLNRHLARTYNFGKDQLR